jgi:cytochrome c biogenesis protein CcdA
MTRLNCACRLALAIALWVAGFSPALAQVVTDKPLKPFDLGSELDGIQFGGLGGAADEAAQFHGFVVPPANGQPALLAVQAIVPPGWHTFSITQPPKGPMRTQIIVDKSPDMKLLGAFQPTSKPELKTEPEIYPGVQIEEHRGTVTWLAPIEIAQNADLKTLKITGRLLGQICTDQIGKCVPFDSPIDPAANQFVATAATGAEISSVRGAAPAKVAVATGEFRTPPDGNPMLRGRIEPQTVQPGGTAKLLLTVEPSPKWHVYTQSDVAPAGAGSRPTLISLTETSGLVPARPVVDQPVVEKKGQKWHEGVTTWTISLTVPAEAKPGQYAISGLLGYQVCSEGCLAPQGVRFDGFVDVGQAAAEGATPLAFTPSSYSAAAASLRTRVPWDSGKAADASAVAPQTAFDPASLPWMILGSLLGGFILNFMPCVLPVIGLKILSFAEQSGQHRVKAFMLNVWYTLGTMSVFLLLAAIAVGVGMLGQHYVQGSIFQSTAFVVSMIALMMAMALSFLGVWEIPIPGFVGAGSASKLAEHEGVMGAFFKGAFATILATPCSGPLLGPVFGFAIAAPWWVTYLIFSCIGLGMSAPYLLIGMFPKLIAFLPKPGAWMETFKQVMAFFLLGTIVYLFHVLDDRFTVPALAIAVAIWFGCWLIGRIPLTASGGSRGLAWMTGVGVTVLVAFLSFRFLVPLETGTATLYGSKVEVKK